MEWSMGLRKFKNIHSFIAIFRGLKMTQVNEILKTTVCTCQEKNYVSSKNRLPIYFLPFIHDESKFESLPPIKVMKNFYVNLKNCIGKNFVLK